MSCMRYAAGTQPTTSEVQLPLLLMEDGSWLSFINDLWALCCHNRASQMGVFYNFFFTMCLLLYTFVYCTHANGIHAFSIGVRASW